MNRTEQREQAFCLVFQNLFNNEETLAIYEENVAKVGKYAKELFEALKANDIYVRYWGSERIEQYLRVTIGTREEMEALFAFLKKYMKKC